MIEHYGSGIKRIKKECDPNGNDYPILHNEMGTFSTTYLPRKADDTTNAINDTTKHDSDSINEPVNEPVNEVVNAPNEVVNEVVKKVFSAIQSKPGIKKPELQIIIGKSHATIERAVDLLKRLSKIEYRGSDKTGGYYAIEQK